MFRKIQLSCFLTSVNTCIAKMEVGCLKYPGASTIGSQPLDWNNAPMTGTTAQPSHEPPQQRKGTGTRHTEKKTSVEKNPTSLVGGRKGKKTADRTQHEGKTERAKESHDRCSQPPGMRMPKTADLGTQALLVVNSFKLHLNAFMPHEMSNTTKCLLSLSFVWTEEICKLNGETLTLSSK